MGLFESITAPLASIGGALINKSSQAAANDTNVQLAKNAQEYDYQKWQETNEYNTPAAQMSRLKEAGLNPNLIYGSGNVTGNQSGGSPKATVAKVNSEIDASQAVNMYQSFMAARKDAAQADLIGEQTNVTKNLALIREAEAAFRWDTQESKKEYEGWRAKNEGYNNMLKRVLLKSNKLTLGVDEKLKPYNLNSNDNSFLRFGLSLGIFKKSQINKFLQNGIGK